MELKIIEKQYARNERYKTNRVKFEVNNCPLYINILYLDLTPTEKTVVVNDSIFAGTTPKRRFNAFICDKLYEQCEQFIKNNFKVDWELFKKYFMYKLYKYSRGVGLDKSELNITPEEIKLVEST